MIRQYLVVLILNKGHIYGRTKETIVLGPFEQRPTRNRLTNSGLEKGKIFIIVKAFPHNIFPLTVSLVFPTYELQSDFLMHWSIY